MPTRKWKKGESGNPKGRPKGITGEAKKTRDLIKEALPDDVMAGIFRSMAAKALKGSESAAKLLFEYRYGKPSQYIGVDVGKDEKSLDQLRAMFGLVGDDA